MDAKFQRVALNDGHSIPVLGLGTYAPDEVIICITFHFKERKKIELG